MDELNLYNFAARPGAERTRIPGERAALVPDAGAPAARAEGAAFGLAVRAGARLRPQEVRRTRRQESEDYTCYCTPYKTIK